MEFASCRSNIKNSNECNELIHSFIHSFITFINVLHPKIVQDSFENSVKPIVKQAELSFHILLVYGKYTIKDKLYPKTNYADAMSNSLPGY